MRKLLVILAALAVVASVGAWTQRIAIKSFVSERTWPGRATYTGEGSKAGEGGMTIEWYEVHSDILDRDLEQVAFIPDGGAAGRGVVFLFHGRGGHPGGYQGQAAEAFTALGDAAPVIVQVAGGDHSYYHDRRDGNWGQYVIDEAIPAAVERFDLDADRVALGGMSMGGFGALDLARLHPDDICAVGGHGAALWESAGDTPPGAFDDAEDFARHDVIGEARANPANYTGLAVWLDTGDADPFLDANRELADALEQGGINVTHHTWPGGHNTQYWGKHFGEYLRFYSDALAACGKL